MYVCSFHPVTCHQKSCIIFCAFGCMYVCMYGYMCRLPSGHHVCACMYVCMNVCVQFASSHMTIKSHALSCVHLYICVYIYIYMYIYIYTVYYLRICIWIHVTHTEKTRLHISTQVQPSPFTYIHIYIHIHRIIPVYTHMDSCHTHSNREKTRLQKHTSTRAQSSPIHANTLSPQSVHNPHSPCHPKDRIPSGACLVALGHLFEPMPEWESPHEH
jgi:hypothetical protein